MPKLHVCRLCCIELEPVALADGSRVLLCAPCDLLGIETDVARGGSLWAAEMIAAAARPRAKAARARVTKGRRKTPARRAAQGRRARVGKKSASI
jgi:hypothetical protein